MIDLDAYAARVGLAAPLKPESTSLAELHQAHVAAIPFENIDVRVGRPMGLDLDSLQAKLVRGRRGGDCFNRTRCSPVCCVRWGSA